MALRKRGGARAEDNATDPGGTQEGPGAPELAELALLVAVAETGSMGQAAARHGLTQPAVSMRMSALEHRLGLKLLRRELTGTRLTAVGEEIVTAARTVLGASAALVAVAARHRAESVSHLRIAASFTVSEHLLPTWIGAIQADAPGVCLTLEVVNSARVLAAVRDRRVDLGFVEGPERELSGLRTETVGVDELALVVPPGHPWARRCRPVSGTELAATELVVREPGSGTRAVIDAALAPFGGTRRRLELGSSAAVLGAARSGEGPAVLSALAAADAVAHGELALVAVDGLNLRRPLRAVWPADVALSRLAAHLLATARQSAVPVPRVPAPRVADSLQRKAWETESIRPLGGSPGAP